MTRRKPFVVWVYNILKGIVLTVWELVTVGFWTVTLFVTSLIGVFMFVFFFVDPTINMLLALIGCGVGWLYSLYRLVHE